MSHSKELASSWRSELPGRDLSNFLLAIYLMRLGRLLDESYNRMCRSQFKISGADMRVMFALRRAGKPFSRRPTDLFRSLLVTSGAITKQVDRLARLGLVQRRPDPGYPGGVLIQLTAKGLRVADAAAERLAVASVAAPAVAELSSAERASALQLCERMLVGLDKTQVPAVDHAHYGKRGRGAKKNGKASTDQPAGGPA